MSLNRTRIESTRSPLQRLLRLPLYYKLVIANGIITLAAVLACASLVAPPADAQGVSSARVYIWLIIAAATILGIAVNSVVVRIALTPVRDLAAAAESVKGGNESVRARVSPVADAATADVVTVFNDMLDSLSHYRRRLREIAIRAIHAGEAERTRLSRELHDGTAQGLAAVLVQTRVAQRTAAPETAAQLDGISEQIAASINELRSLAQSLRPPSLDMIGLSAAVRSYARQFSDTSGIRTRVNVSGDVDNVLPNPAEVAIYRIVQDALQNVVQHSRSQSVTLELVRRSDAIIATVTDDGIGFDVARSMAGDALGLFGMHERALYVGGRVDLVSSDKGTAVTITIPTGDTMHE